MLTTALCLVLAHSGSADAAPEGAAATPDATAPPATSSVPALAFPDGIWERLTLEAEGRVRGESTFDQPNGVDRHRGRFRFRIGGTYALTDTVKFGARLSTQSEGRDANNPHWDFGGGDGFSASEVGFDRVFLEWAALEELSLTAGKFGDPFSRPPIASEFAWDGDVQPAGAAAVWKPATDGRLGYDVRAIAGVAGEVNSAAGSSTDPGFVGAQGNLYFDASDALRLQFSSAYTDWVGLKNFTLDQGNTAGAGGFAIWDSFLAATWKGGPLEQVRGYTQFLTNLDDDSGEDTGFSAGVQVGRTSGAGAWNGFAAFYSLDANSVFSSVAQDDTPIAGTGIGTGMNGVVAGGEYFITDDFSARLWGLTSDADAAEDPFRVRLDFNFRVR